MEIKELMNSKVSLYKRVSENKSCMTITLDDWLHKVSPAAGPTITKMREVNKDDPKAAKAMKTMNLPCVTISAVFEGERKTDLVSEMNPIICIDIDELPFACTWDEVKKKVFDLPYVFYVSLSARGEGVFALVHYNTENSILDTFRSLEDDFKKMDIIIDSACKDITRLRFVSYDDNALEKEGDVEMYDKVLEEKKEEYDDIPDNYRKKKYEDIDSDYLAMKTILHLITYCGYRADTYEDWLVEGFRLASLGESGYSLFMYLSQMSDGWNERAAQLKWRECLRNTKMGKDSLAHYFAVAKDKLGSNWRNIVRNT